ncbi:hypothetical protein CH263_13385 [Rhodococcus sp. 06-1059B-a]|nr:hypothetical protein [Rhodococcus sp. 06-1059B-a]OZD65131.1 hypothetical protein CH263_13385 [Rhodococcus sp. 06-1059B-a]
MRNPDFEQLTEKDLAETIPCRDCGAPKGQPCQRVDYDGTRHELLNLPAHPKRTKRAQRLQRMASEENLTMNDDTGLFEIAEPEWQQIPVEHLGDLERGRTIELDGEQFTFSGTSRGADEDGPYIDVYGRDGLGCGRKFAKCRAGETVRVKAAGK